MQTCFIRYLYFCLFYFLCLAQIGVRAWTNTDGGDHSGAYWEPVSGSTIAGYHFNISSFTIPSGATIYVQPYDGDTVSTTDPCTSSGKGFCDNGASPSGFIEIEAGTVTIDGLLEASERGYRGKSSGGGSNPSGEGPGGGGCANTAAFDGGGAGYGGSGGSGEYTSGGSAYGAENGPFYMGSGGGGGNPNTGGNGGGLVIIKATYSFTVAGSGQIQVNGNSGGGGGAGGGIFVQSSSITFNSGSILSAAGGGGSSGSSGQAGRNGTGGTGTYSAGGGPNGAPGNGSNRFGGVGGNSAGGGGSGSGGAGAGRIHIKYNTINGLNRGNTTYWQPTSGITIGPWPYLVLLTVPETPTNLTVSFVDSTSTNTLKLDWLDNSNNETGFRLERSSDNVTFNLVNGSISANTTTYTDTGLSANTTYWFRVVAYNGAGDSPWATSSPKTTMARWVTNAQIYVVYNSSVTVTWTPVNAGQANSYTLQSSTDSNFTTIIKSSSTTDIAASTLTIIDLLGSGTYYFRIASFNHSSTANYSINVSTYVPGDWSNVQGGDHNGADWTPVDGSTVAGYHYDIGNFTIPSGATIYVQPYDGGSVTLLSSGRGYADDGSSPSGFLEIEAATVTINGILEASGSGYRETSSTGEGPGGGLSHSFQWTAGGGGYGGSGGTVFNCCAGSSYGVSTGPIYMGSAGGSYTGFPNMGGKGGGLVIVKASYSFTVSGAGKINANGYGGKGTDYGGGGGAGGGIYIDAKTVSLNSSSVLSAAGGGGGGALGAAGGSGSNGTGGTGGSTGNAGGGPGTPGNGGGDASPGGSAGGAGNNGGGGGSGRILMRYWSINDNDYANGYWDPAANISNSTIGSWP